MTITITPAHNEARLTGTLNHLDSGPGNATVFIYGGTRAAVVTDAPASAALVQVTLAKPCGVVADGLLTLHQLEDGMILNTGVATWARVVNAAGVTAFDCDCGEGAGAWEVQLAQANLYAGGAARITSAVLG